MGHTPGTPGWSENVKKGVGTISPSTIFHSFPLCDYSSSPVVVVPPIPKIECFQWVGTIAQFYFWGGFCFCGVRLVHLVDVAEEVGCF